MDFQEIDLNCIVSAPFEENSFIVSKKGRKDCFIIDPGLEPQRIIDFLEKNELTPTAFLITHGHSDHIGGNQALKDRWPDCPLVIGKDDADKLTDPQQNLSAAFGTSLFSPPADVTLDDGEVY
ncbi:MAG: MBL fold metallo-hydrolase, partial [Pirellulales bacterium]|nr:MBL fold metallo-hydrolase [Pirellulales bacterium]